MCSVDFDGFGLMVVYCVEFDFSLLFGLFVLFVLILFVCVIIVLCLFLVILLNSYFVGCLMFCLDFKIVTCYLVLIYYDLCWNFVGLMFVFIMFGFVCFLWVCVFALFALGLGYVWGWWFCVFVVLVLFTAGSCVVIVICFTLLILLLIAMDFVCWFRLVCLRGLWSFVF